MNHHCSGSGHHNADGSFSNSILPLGTHSAEPNALVSECQFFSEGLALVDAVVSVVGVNVNSHV